MFKDRSLFPMKRIYQLENGQFQDPDYRQYYHLRNRSSVISKFCSESHITVKGTIATVYYHTGESDSGPTPQGLRVDFSTTGMYVCV